MDKEWVYRHLNGTETRVGDASGYEEYGWRHEPAAGFVEQEGGTAMSGQTYFERDDDKIARVAPRGGCAEPGPYGTVCTEDVLHRYSHYDAPDDSSWQNDWRENGPDEDEADDGEGQVER